jgi:hypothetical protein
LPGAAVESFIRARPGFAVESGKIPEQLRIGRRWIWKKRHAAPLDPGTPYAARGHTAHHVDTVPTMLALLAKNLFDAALGFSGDMRHVCREQARLSLTRWRCPTESALIVGSRDVTVMTVLPHRRGAG